MSNAKVESKPKESNETKQHYQRAANSVSLIFKLFVELVYVTKDL